MVSSVRLPRMLIILDSSGYGHFNLMVGQTFRRWVQKRETIIMNMVPMMRKNRRAYSHEKRAFTGSSGRRTEKCIRSKGLVLPRLCWDQNFKGPNNTNRRLNHTTELGNWIIVGVGETFEIEHNMNSFWICVRHKCAMWWNVPGYRASRIVSAIHIYVTKCYILTMTDAEMRKHTSTKV